MRGDGGRGGDRTALPGAPASANGGYTCGVIAGAAGGRSAEVNLRRPPPLDKPLALEESEGGFELRDGDQLVADGHALDGVPLEIPEAPPFHDAEDADARSAFYDDHSFPGCFVCGPDRRPGDGLRIYPGVVAAHRAMACVWTPDPRLADDEGQVEGRIVWAALDCPSGIAAHHSAPDEPRTVLARLRGHLERPLEAGRPHIVIGWPISREGRKHVAGTAICEAGGEPVAWADTLWIELKPDQ